MKTTSFFFTFFFLSCCLLSCSPDATLGEPTDAQQKARLSDCDPDVICTAIFASISASLKYPDTTPVRLDSYQVIETSTGVNKTPTISLAELEMYRKVGVYPITNDTYHKELFNQKQQVEFIGYKDGKEVVRRKFTVSADCCHVTHLDGELEIIIEK